MLGIAVLSETFEHGAHVGYRITCRRHKDANNNLECKKDITMGKTEDRLENSECIRRLKRWFVAGANPVVEASWPEDKKRLHHVWHYGGNRLKELATDYVPSPLYGVEDDELDALCRTTPATDCTPYIGPLPS